MTDDLRRKRTSPTPEAGGVTASRSDRISRGDSLTTLRGRLAKIEARLTRHARRLILQMAEVVIPRDLFGQILIRLRPLPLVPA